MLASQNFQTITRHKTCAMESGIDSAKPNKKWDLWLHMKLLVFLKTKKTCTDSLLLLNLIINLKLAATKTCRQQSGHHMLQHIKAQYMAEATVHCKVLQSQISCLWFIRNTYFQDLVNSNIMFPLSQYSDEGLRCYKKSTLWFVITDNHQTNNR